MSYTENINSQARCNYINPMISNARDMLNPCINIPNYKPNYQVNLESNLCNGREIPQEEEQTREDRFGEGCENCGRPRETETGEDRM